MTRARGKAAAGYSWEGAPRPDRRDRIREKDDPVPALAHFHRHLDSITPGLSGDLEERIAIRMEAGQDEERAASAAYFEICKSAGIQPRRPG